MSLASATRSRVNQRQAGGSDRRASDDGGHYIAARFNGPRDAFNHFAQDANFNRGGYRALEDRWAEQLRKGGKVHVKIVPLYDGKSQRPYSLELGWSMNGRIREKSFPNELKGGSSDK